MRKILAISVLVFAFFLIEFALFNLLGSWFTPQFLIILIIFFTLYLGIRYGILTALLAGLMKDSFGVSYFGLNIFSLTLCAYLTTLIKRYLYQVGSISSGVLMVFLISVFNVLIHSMIILMFAPIDLRQIIISVAFPEILLTTLIAQSVFRKLREWMARVGI